MSTQATALEGPERLLGTRVLDFELTGVLGAGGMSVVYRAQHRLTQQEVAIKILPPELAVHADLKARFVEEARVLARLEHPNIVALNNFTESGGRLCLVMSFVPGVTFEQMILDRGKVDPVETVRIGVEVLKALEYAHGQNVIHRDIKPSNVLVRGDGAVKVTDFGIAKILGQTRLTSTGQTMGTVRYMSPEQVRGRGLDARSDLYSLGITLYEALAGRTPFDGENQFEIMQQQITKQPPALAKLGVNVSPALEKLLRVALQKDPRDRFADAKTFRERLEAIVPVTADNGTGAEIQSLKRTGSTRRTAAFLGAGVVAAALGGVLYLAGRPPKPTPTIAPVHAPAPSWPAPYVVPGVVLTVDEKFPAAGLRVQSATPRDAKALRDSYLALLTSLREFLARQAIPAARSAAAAWAPPPLNLTIVPEGVLNQPALWPGYPVTAGSTYPSRYIEPKGTLFISDSPGVAERELPYGVALHVLAPVRAITTDQCLEIAEKFAAWVATHAPR